MGTTLTLSVTSPSRDSSIRAIDSALARVRVVDDLLNDWRADSELGRFNRAAPGLPASISPGLAGYLAEVSEWTQASGGAIDPAIGALIDAWDLRGPGQVPRESLLAQARAGSGMYRFQPDWARRTAMRPTAGSWIDAGSFGKGAALRAMGQELERRGALRAVLNFGGQVLAVGDTTVTIEVAHPERRFEPAARISLTRASASTSGQSERLRVVDGVSAGHLLDPRSGRPVPPWGSVTVIHPDPMTADILSTALFVMGPEAGMTWAASHDIAALFLVAGPAGPDPRWSPSFMPYLPALRPSTHGD